MNEELRARYLDGEPLDADERSLLGDEQVELDAIAALLGEVELWEEPPADLEDRVVASIRGAATGDGGDGGDAADAAVIPLGEARRRSRRSAIVAAAAAALVAAGVTAAVASWAGDDGGRRADLEVALPDGRPGRVEVTDTESGLEILLDAPDLARLPDGQYYQAWLRSADGERLVAIGTFHSGRDVILWAGVTVEAFPTLTVTIEPDDGDPASSGDRVLVVPLVAG